MVLHVARKPDDEQTLLCYRYKPAIGNDDSEWAFGEARKSGK